MPAMLEIEVKFVLPDATALRSALAARGAPMVEDRTDADHYFNAPDRDFAVTGEAFRIRRIGERNLITWKGPRLQAIAKSREEIEIPFADGDKTAEELCTLLSRLGYRSVAIVRKHRQVYALQVNAADVQVCIDDVENVGSFAEVEIMAEPDARDAAESTLLKLASELGLTQMERRSYLSMLLAER